MTLNGWQRLGVVLSIVWVIIGLLFDPLEIFSSHISNWEKIIILLITVLFWWVGAYAALFAFRWVRKGFEGNHEPTSIDSSIVTHSPVDRPISTPVPQPHERHKIRASIIKARNGEERLWIVFWIYTVIGILFTTSLYNALLQAITDLRGYGPLVLLFVLVIAYLAYIVWAMGSLWRCAFNVGWKGWGYLARACVVWNILVFLVIVVSAVIKQLNQ